MIWVMLFEYIRFKGKHFVCFFTIGRYYKSEDNYVRSLYCGFKNLEFFVSRMFGFVTMINCGSVIFVSFQK